MTLKSYVFIKLQYIVPQKLLSGLLGCLANCRIAWFKNWFIRWFIQRYQINLNDAVEPNPNYYLNFNQFFTRALKPEKRPIDDNPNAIISPADACLSQFGRIQDKQLIQAKGKHYTLNALLAKQHEWEQDFLDGQFACFYLSPKDYHRVHLPLDGVLTDMFYVPGRLFSVNLQTASAIDNLFGRNERVICLFETNIGKMAVILVGAMLVGSIHTVWHGQVTPPHGKQTQHWHYQHHPELQFKRGDEIGHFQFGSTVIVLFEKDKMQWSEHLRLEQQVNMGQAVGLL